MILIDIGKLKGTYSSAIERVKAKQKLLKSLSGLRNLAIRQDTSRLQTGDIVWVKLEKGYDIPMPSCFQSNGYMW